MERATWKLPLPYVKQIANGNLLYDSGNSNRVSLSTQRGGMGREIRGRLQREGIYVSFQFSHSVVSNSLRPHGLQHARTPCPSPSLSLLKLMSIESVMPSNHLILCQPLLLLPSKFPIIRIFSNESVLGIRWPKYWELQHQSFQRIFRVDFLQD